MIPSVSNDDLAQVTGTIVPIALTIGMAYFHEDANVFIQSLVPSVCVAIAFGFGGAAVMEFILPLIGGKRIQGEERSTKMPSIWIESLENLVCQYIAALMLAWPVSWSRLGYETALVWKLNEAYGQPWGGIPFLVAQTIGWILIMDTYLYFKHRILHTKPLWFAHRGHHQYHDPSVWTSFSVHPIEAVITFWPLGLLSRPELKVFAPVHLSWAIGYVFINIYIHSGYNVWWVDRLLQTFWINSSSFHNVHHKLTLTHYGEMMPLWDYILGTHDNLDRKAKEAAHKLSIMTGQAAKSKAA